MLLYRRTKVVFIFLLICISSANAESDEKHNNQKISFYMHPFSLEFAYILSQITFVEAEEKPNPLYAIYLTLEFPLSLSNSLMIQPSFWHYSQTAKEYRWGYGDGNKTNKMLRLGLGAGLRHFINGNGAGLYLQAIGNVYYYSINELDEYDNPHGVKKSFYADMLGYLGYSWKFSRHPKGYASLSIFFDIGLGAIYPASKTPECMIGSYTIDIIDFYKKFLAYDANLGIGLSF